MNILLLVLGYFLYTMFSGSDEKKFISGINFEKLAPLLSMFSGGGLNLGTLLESDFFKNSNFLGMDMAKITPIIELLSSLSKNPPPAGTTATQKSAPEAAPASGKFPLAPISDIADKNITYSLTRYLSEK